MEHLWTTLAPSCWPGHSWRCPALPEHMFAMQIVIVISLVGTLFAQVRGCRATLCLLAAAQSSIANSCSA